MSLVYWLQQPGGTLLDITSRCRLYQFDMQEKAEEGSVAVNSLIIDDKDGTLEMFGHRVLAVEETEAVDPEDRFVYVGFIGKVKTIRGPYRTGVSRQYVCEVSDPNTILSRRVMRGDDNDRSEETDNARIGWVLTTHESNAIDDTRYVTSDDPWDMDEADYLLQEALAVYADCSQQSGKNYFVTYFGDVGVTTNVPWGYFSLWYEHAAAEVYQSTATLTNIEGEVNVAAGAFYIGLLEETSLDRDPMRVYSDVSVPYKESYESASNPTTRSTFARRDKVMPAINVRRASTAKARAQRYVNDLATPEDRATVKTTVPRSLVNLIRPGMQVPVKVSHWPGYEDDYLWMRVLSRRVKEIAETEYAAFELTLELSRGLPGPIPGPLFGILYGSRGPFPGMPGHVWWATTGDAPGPGWPVQPTTGLIEAINDPMNGRPFSGWKVLGTGTIDVHAFITIAGVLASSVTIHVAIQKNGVDVADQDVTPTYSGGLLYINASSTVDIDGLSVAPDDEITVALSWSGTMHFGRTPAGTGQNGESLAITGGSLV